MFFLWYWRQPPDNVAISPNPPREDGENSLTACSVRHLVHMDMRFATGLISVRMNNEQLVSQKRKRCVIRKMYRSVRTNRLVSMQVPAAKFDLSQSAAPVLRYMAAAEQSYMKLLNRTSQS